MKPIEYVRPQSLEELFGLLSAHGSNARLLAGGTDVVVRLRKPSASAQTRDESSSRPLVVIDLKRIAALRSDVTAIPSGIRIGARAVMTDLIDNSTIQHRFPALRDAALVVGSVQIRNRATLAGNICNASPAADTAPALLAYGGRANVIGASGSRQLALEEFFAGPGRTTLCSGEIVESIDLPLPSSNSGASFQRLTRRHGVDLAIVSVCCVAAPGSVRFGLGAVGPRPLFVHDDTGILTDDASTAERNETLRRLLAEASPISDLRARDDYRSAMLGVLARRALDAATRRMRNPGDPT